MARKVNVLIDSRVVVEPTANVLRWERTPEERAAALERWANEVRDFFRDHRSMDVNTVFVDHDRRDECSACHRPWEVDDTDGIPCCGWCGEAVDVTDAALAATASLVEGDDGND